MLHMTLFAEPQIRFSVSVHTIKECYFPCYGGKTHCNTFTAFIYAIMIYVLKDGAQRFEKVSVIILLVSKYEYD